MVTMYSNFGDVFIIGELRLIISILEVRKLILREVKSSDGGHIARWHN